MSGVDNKELDRMLQQAFDASSKIYQERGFQRRGVEWLSFGEGIAQFLQARFVFGSEIFFGRVRVILNLVLEIKSGVASQLGKKFDLALARIESGFDKGQREFVRVEAGSPGRPPECRQRSGCARRRCQCGDS